MRNYIMPAQIIGKSEFNNIRCLVIQKLDKWPHPTVYHHNGNDLDKELFKSLEIGDCYLFHVDHYDDDGFPRYAIKKIEEINPTK